MKRPIGHALAEWEEKEPIPNRAANSTPPIRPSQARNEVPERPTAAYLRHLIRTLTGDTTTPIKIRCECDELMRAINANDLPSIIEQVARLGRLADAEGFMLPRLDREPSQRD